MKGAKMGSPSSPGQDPIDTGNGSDLPDPMDNGSRIVSWRDWDSIADRDNLEELRGIVRGIFRDEIMLGLALLIIPVLILLDFVDLPRDLRFLLNFLNVAIWIFFVLEYICRLIVAEDRAAFVIRPWNVLDLVIVGAPLVAILLGTGYGIARYFRVLRAMQAIQVLNQGSKTAKRHLFDKKKIDKPDKQKMQVRSLPLDPGKTDPVWHLFQGTPSAATVHREGNWIDFSGLSTGDLPFLSEVTGTPPYLLNVRFQERAYPRTSVMGKSMMVYLKIPFITREEDQYRVWKISWEGLLVTWDDQGVMTFAHSSRVDLDDVLHKARTWDIPLQGASIVYLLLSNALSTVENLILLAEEQLLYLETMPMNRLPDNFLTMMYNDQKELGRINSVLFHTRTAVEEISSPDHALFRGSHGDTERLKALSDRISMLSDNATHISDAFSWMVDFYLNATSFSMNRVMKLLAVLTALTMVPTIVGGLLGMNLIGNPWPATLLQMVFFVVLVMGVMGWVYYNLGWLKQ